MGDVQSTQRGSRQDAAAEEENKEVDNPQTEQNTKHETFKNSEQSSAVSRKGEEVKMNGCHEDENEAQALPLIPTKEGAPETQGNEEESQGEVDANDGVPLEITELDVKQNDINSFGRFFSNIGLKLTINRGSGEKVDDNKETNTEESEETKTEKTEDKTEGETEQDSSDPTCPILTAVASEDVENADKTAETAEEPELKAESKEEPHSTNPTGPGDVEIDSPIRRFFATGIFAGLWKKKEAGDETTEKDLEEMGENQVTETTGQTAQERRDEEPTAPGELRDEVPGKSPEPDILASPERDRAETSPLLRFLSGSSLKRLSMKQRNIKSSEARLCDSGEHPAELAPSEPAEDHRNAPAPTSAAAAKEGEGAWASFKRFMSPNPRMKKSYHSAEETQQPASVEEPRAEQTSDHNSEEGKKRKNSSVSWEAVLCGSGRRRSRKTSDSEDEMSPIDLKYRKENGKPKSGEDSGAENEKETTSPKLDGRLQEDDGGSTWKSLKRIVTPKRKSRDEDEAIKIKIQSGGEGGQENSSFSIKNLLPGRKKQRSEESQGQLSSDEAEKDLASDDEDSETPGVVPLSEFEVDEEENESLEQKEKLELQQDQGADVKLGFPQDFDEDSEKRDRNEGPDDVPESASKHQHLSDIPEEGVITEPWAAPAADLTLQDETEMFTAASQFSSDSATTSSNATPAPAERHIVETHAVLHQVAETFSASPKTRAAEPEQTSEGGVKKESTILEIHRSPEATSTETGLHGEDLEGLSGLVSASSRGGISEVEFKSVGFKEFDSTDHTGVEDEERPSAEEEEDVQDLAKEPIKALASGGGNETDGKEIREAGDETLPLTEANGDAEDAKQVQEPEIEGPVEGLGPSLEPKVIYDNISMCLGTEGGGEKPELETCLLTEVVLEQLDAKSVEKPEDLQAEQVSSLKLQETSSSSHEPQMISENLATGETAKDEADETQILTETDESAEAPQEPEVLQAVQELSPNVGEVSILVLETEVASSETPKEINVSDDIMKLQDLNDCTRLTEDIRQLVEASKTAEEPEVSQAASSLASDKGNDTSVETEQKADNLPKEEIVVEENKKESILTKDTLESEEPEATKVVWPPAEEDNVLPPETQIMLKADLDTHEDKIQTKLMTEDTSEPLNDTKNVCMAVHPTAEESEHASLVKEAACDHVSELEPVPDEPKQEAILSDTKLQSLDPPETVQEAEVSQVLQQSLESAEPDITSEIILTEETAPDEPKEELKLHSEITLEPEDPSETDGEAEAVLKVLQRSLESEETKAETSDNISGEKTVPGEPRDETSVAGETSSEPVDESKTAEAEVLKDVHPQSLEPEESRGQSAEGEVTSDNISEETTDKPRHERTAAGETSSDPVDDSKAAEVVELEAVETSAFMSEESSRSTLTAEETSENILKIELDTAENQETILVMVEAPEEKPDTDERKVETLLVKEEPEFSQSVQSSSGQSEDNSVPSAEPEIRSEIILTEETVPDEPGDGTTVAGETSSDPVDDSKTLEVVELETVETSAFMSEESSRSTLTAEETSENILKIELDTAENQETILVMVEAPEEKPAEEPELSQTLQVSSLESEDNRVPSAEPEITSEIILTEETVPDEPGDGTTVAGETSSDPVDDSKAAEVVEELETVETSSLVREESSISPYKPEETSKNIPKAESDVDENKAETRLVTEEQPEFSQSVESSALESEDDSVPSAEPEITSEIILTEETVPDEPGDGTTDVGETSSDPVDDSKAAEELETVETSSLVREESSTSPYEPQETSENTESDKNENKAETTLHNECLTESEDASRVLDEAEELKTVLQAERQTLAKEETAADEAEDVKRVATESLFEKVDVFRSLQMSSFESEESSIPSSGPEASSENVLKAELDTDQHETQTTFITEDTSEPPDDPQNPEGAELAPNVQPSSEETEKILVSSLEAEEISENTPKAETQDPEAPETLGELESEQSSLVKEVTCDHASEKQPVPDEAKQETILSDTNSQSVDPSETVEEDEVSQVLQQSLQSEESKEEPSDNISEKETVPGEPRDETTLAGEPVDDSKTVEVGKELTQTLQTSSLASHQSSRSIKAEKTSENIQRADSDTDETLVVKEEPEFSQSVQSSSGQSEDNGVPSAEPEIRSEIILTETVPDKPKEEIKLHSEITLKPEEPSETAEAEVLKNEHPQSLEPEESRGQSAEGEVTSDNISEETTDKPRTAAGETSTEPVDDSKAAEVVEELETVETSSQEEYKSCSPPPEAEETSDISKAETVSDKTKEEMRLDPEDSESADESEALTAVNPSPESEHPSLAKEATCAHISGEEMVPGEPKEEPINEILDASISVQDLERIQDLLVPSLDSGDLEVKSNNVAEAETDTALLSEVRLKPVDIQEPEVLKTVQAASFQSVDTSDETQVTPENIPKAEPAPEEEDLTVEATTNDLKTEQIKDDRCSGTETEAVEDEGPAAPHMDKCHPSDILREQTSEALMVMMQAGGGVKEEVEAATPSVRDGVAEEDEGGKAEDTVEVAVVDAGTTSEGTTVDSVLEGEETEVKGVTDVCCRVVHAVESLSANKELEKEQILKEDEATTEEEKVQVDDEVEKESNTVQATEASHSPSVTEAKEADQDEWMDAEENIDIQEETASSFYEAEEPLESPRGDEDVEQAGLERELETAHASRTEGEGSEETNKADEACGFESEEEYFEVALEHPGNTSIAAVPLTG